MLCIPIQMRIHCQKTLDVALLWPRIRFSMSKSNCRSSLKSDSVKGKQCSRFMLSWYYKIALWMKQSTANLGKPFISYKSYQLSAMCVSSFFLSVLTVHSSLRWEMDEDILFQAPWWKDSCRGPLFRFIILHWTRIRGKTILIDFSTATFFTW